MSLVRFFHILVVGSLFLYVGIKRTEIPKFMYPVLLGLGAVIVAYHGYKATSKPSNAWVNLIHVLLVGPLLMYIGWTGDQTPRKFFEILMMFGFAAIGYHGYYTLHDLNRTPAV